MKYSSPLYLAHDPDHPDRSVKDRILSILVAEWSDGFELWRTIQPYQSYSYQGPLFDDHLLFDLVHPLISQTGKMQNIYETPVGERMKIETPSRFDKKKYGNLLDKIRWALWRLGLIEEGASPLPQSMRPTNDNPWIGRFKGWTEDEVFADAKRLEQLFFLKGLPLSIGEELFADGTEVQLASVSSGQILFQLWRPVGRRGTFQAAEKILPDLPSFVEWVMRKTKSTIVLPRSEAIEWWDAHCERGELTVPDEELEVLEMLGEPLPYVWEAERLAEWAAERWGDR